MRWMIGDKTTGWNLKEGTGNMEILFIGGPRDGQMLAVSQRCLNFGRVEVPNTQVPINRLELPLYHVECVLYRILKFDVCRERCYVAVAESIQNPLDHLIKGYKPQ